MALTLEQKFEIGRILSDIAFMAVGIAVLEVPESNLADALTRAEERIVKVVDGE